MPIADGELLEADDLLAIQAAATAAVDTANHAQIIAEGALPDHRLTRSEQQLHRRPTMPLQPTDPVSITLEAQQWNSILATLHDAPYRVAAPLIESIATQARAAEPAQQEVLPPVPRIVRPNGHDNKAEPAA